MNATTTAQDNKQALTDLGKMFFICQLADTKTINLMLMLNV